MADKGLTTEQLDAMDNSQLSKELEKAKAELFNLRFAQAVGNLEDHGRMRPCVATLPGSTPSRVSGSLATAPPRALRSEPDGRNHRS